MANMCALCRIMAGMEHREHGVGQANMGGQAGRQQAWTGVGGVRANAV